MGFIPLIPYFFVDTELIGLKYFTMITLVCLFIFGFFKSKMTGVNLWIGGLKVMLIGTTSAFVAFGSARLIESA